VRQTDQLQSLSVLDVIADQRRLIDVEMGYTQARKQVVYDAITEMQRAVGGRDR